MVLTIGPTHGVGLKSQATCVTDTLTEKGLCARLSPLTGDFRATGGARLLHAVGLIRPATRCCALMSALLPVALAGCGGDDPPPALPTTSGQAVAHIHGLGVDPGDQSLLIATHNGLFRAPDGKPRAQRVGESTQDTMGFTVAGPNRYLGSGHPGVESDGPSMLGLIESRDGGHAWRPVALSGQVDFHILRVAGRRVYGFDSTSGRLLVSRDRGRSWASGTPPGPLIDLAVDPQDQRHLVASTDEGLWESQDGGAEWQQVSETVGLLAYRSSILHVIEADGRALESDDDGRSLRRTGALGSRPVALVAADGRLFAATESSEVKQSQDGGRTWNPRARL